MTGRLLAGSLVLMTLVAGPSADAVRAQSDPMIAARGFVDAVRAQDYERMASLMHPDALRELRSLFDPIFESPQGAAVRQQLLGTGEEVSNAQLFVRLMQFVVSQRPELGEALQNADAEMLGYIEEGSDTVHVVYRLSMTMRGIDMSQMDVLSLKRSDAGWRGLLKGDIANMAAALRQAVGVNQGAGGEGEGGADDGSGADDGGDQR